MENYIVEKSNILNTLSCHSFGLTELRFFCMYLSKLNAREKQRTVEIPISDFENFFNCKINTTEFTKKIEKIASRTIKVTENNNMMVLTLYSAFCWSNSAPNTLKIICNDMILPYIFELQKNYTAYRLKNISKLNSVQKIRLYEIMKQYEKIKTITIVLEELKSMMCNNVNSDFKHFRYEALEPAIKDINEYTDLTVKYEKILKCRKCVALKFFIESKSEKERLVETEKQEIKQISVVETPKTLEDLYKKYFNSEQKENFRENIKMALQDIYKSEAIIKERTEVIYKQCVNNFKINSQTTDINSPLAYMQGIINNIIKEEIKNPKKEKRRSYDINQFEKFAINYPELQKVENREVSESHSEPVLEPVKETKVICPEKIEMPVPEPLSTVSDEIQKIFDETPEGIALFSKVLEIINTTTEYNATVSILDIVDGNWKKFEGICKQIIVSKLKEKENAPELIEIFL